MEVPSALNDCGILPLRGEGKILRIPILFPAKPPECAKDKLSGSSCKDFLFFFVSVYQFSSPRGKLRGNI